MSNTIETPQEIIRNSWSRHTDVPFSSYTIVGSDNRGALVKGALYEIDVNDLSKLNIWDLALPFYFDNATGKFVYPGWRGLDLVELSDGRKVTTFSTYPEQQVDRVVDGLDYNPFLNDRAITMRVINEVMGN